MKRLEFLQKPVYQKLYIRKISAVNLSKIYFLKNAKETCKPNNRDLNRDWITNFILFLKLVSFISGREFFDIE